MLKKYSNIKKFGFFSGSDKPRILNAHKYNNIKKFGFFSGSDKPRMLFFLLINDKMLAF